MTVLLLCGQPAAAAEAAPLNIPAHSHPPVVDLQLYVGWLEQQQPASQQNKNKNSATEEGTKQYTTKFLVCWFAFANVFYLFKRKAVSGAPSSSRSGSPVKVLALSRPTAVKDLIDYTRCDQCRANIKIGLLRFFEFTFQLICITHPLHGNGKIKIYWNWCRTAGWEVGRKMKCMSVEETFRPVILAGFCGPGHGRHRDNEVLIMLNSINHLRRLILYVRFTFSKLNGRECGERNLINPVKGSIHDNNKNANTEKDLQTRIM